MKKIGMASLAISMLGYEACTKKTESKLLRLYGTGTLDIKDWSRLKSELNIDLIFTDNGNDPGPVITKMITGTASNDFDIGGLQGGAERELAQAGVIIPWDLEKIPNWKNLWDWAQNVPYAKHDSKQYGLPIVINADSIIYLPEKMGVVDSYAVIFDRKYKGKTAMEDAWINSAIFTAIYLKESGEVGTIINPGDLTEDELGKVMEYLIGKKRDGQFLTFWQGWENGLKLIKSKEIWAMTGWEPIVYAARELGINVEYAVPKEGYEGWSNDLILHKGVVERNVIDIAHQFANWELEGYYGCSLAKLRGYVVPNNTYKNELANPKSVFDSTQINNVVSNVERKFLQMKGNVYWQNVRPRNYKLYESWWSKLRAS